MYVCMQHGCRSSDAEFRFSAQNVHVDVNGTMVAPGVGGLVVAAMSSAYEMVQT